MVFETKLGDLGAAHTSETNSLKHVARNMKYLYDTTNHAYISMEQRTLWDKKHVSWNAYISQNLWIALYEEMLRNFRRCHEFCRFKFLSVHWAANTLHAIYLRNMLRAICFVGVHRALNSWGKTKLRTRFSENKTNKRQFPTVEIYLSSSDRRFPAVK